jgi:hypothetical protein
LFIVLLIILILINFQNDTTKETTSATRNIKDGYYYSYNLFIQKKISRWWNLTLSGFIYNNNYSGVINGVAFNRGAFAFNSNINNDFVLPKNFKVQVSAFYSGPSVFGITNIKSLWSLDIGVRKTLLNDKLTISASIFDLFYKNVFSMTSKFINQDLVFIAPSDTRRAWVSLLFKFGKIKVQKRQVNSNDQEKGRLEDKLKQ